MCEIPGISVFKAFGKGLLNVEPRMLARNPLFFNWVKRVNHGINQSIDSEPLRQVKTLETTILSQCAPRRFRFQPGLLWDVANLGLR